MSTPTLEVYEDNTLLTTIVNPEYIPVKGDFITLPLTAFTKKSKEYFVVKVNVNYGGTLGKTGIRIEVVPM